MVSSLVGFLEDPSNEDRTVEEVATLIYDGFFSLLKKGLKDSPPTLSVGVAFKSLVTGKVHHVAWQEKDLAWVISGDTRYGYLGRLDSWSPYAAESRAKAGAPGNNPDWKVGDKVTSMRKSYCHTVIATADKCVLLRGEYDLTGRPYSEPNDSMERYYEKV